MDVVTLVIFTYLYYLIYIRILDFMYLRDSMYRDDYRMAVVQSQANINDTIYSIHIEFLLHYDIKLN